MNREFAFSFRPQVAAGTALGVVDWERRLLPSQGERITVPLSRTYDPDLYLPLNTMTVDYQRQWQTLIPYYAFIVLTSLLFAFFFVSTFLSLAKDSYFLSLLEALGGAIGTFGLAGTGWLSLKQRLH